jgi:Ca2+-binding EF-hand superfamily protein
LHIADLERGCSEIISKEKTFVQEPDWSGLVSALDVNGDRMVDYNEFLTAAYNRNKLINNQNLKKAFEVLDRNKDGVISKDELKQCFSGYISVASEETWAAMFNEVDENQDGAISYPEFESQMQKALDLNYFGKGMEKKLCSSGGSWVI